MYQQCQGHSKKEMTGPYVVGWFLGGQNKYQYQGWSDFFSRFFNHLFKLPSPRNAQKRVKQNREKISFGFFCRFFGKTFSVMFFNSHHYEAPKNAIKQKNSRKN
jgi:hypothetical protein